MSRSQHFRLPGSRVLKPGTLPRVYRVLLKSGGHQAWWPGRTAFEVMVGAILTQNTAWTNVERAILNLRKAHALNPRAIQRMRPSKLARLIRPAGYFNVKARRLKHFVTFLFREYGGKPARMFAEPGEKLRTQLLRVHGVGPETADSILLYAGQKRFFVIDAYTKRIFGRHGLENPESDYETWRRLFERALPRSIPLYNDFHAQIVRIGKDFCKGHPRCEACPLGVFL